MGREWSVVSLNSQHQRNYAYYTEVTTEELNLDLVWVENLPKLSKKTCETFYDMIVEKKFD